MKRKLFILFALAAVIIASSGTALAQGPLQPAIQDAWSAPKQAISALQTAGSTDSWNFKNGAAQATTSDPIRDGGFEKGRNIEWGEYSSHGYPLVMVDADLPLPAHSGTHAVWLGGADNETSYVIQYGIPIHKPAKVLHVWYLIASQETTCGNDVAAINIYTDKVYTWDLCDAHNSTDWIELTVDLSAYDGMDKPLSFSVVTNGSVNSNLFIDDISLGGVFVDLPTTHPNFTDIEALYANGLTGGCSTNPLMYCPEQTMDRGQAAVFMLRGNFGSSFVPAPVTHVLNDDWTKGTWAEPWAEAMYFNGLSAGCSASPLKYCPWEQIPREQAVIFALRMKYGMNYIPPAATGTMFADMTDVNYYATPWAEQAYTDGLIPSCGTSAGKPMICPKSLVSRGLGAYMIVKAKNLTIP